MRKQGQKLMPGQDMRFLEYHPGEDFPPHIDAHWPAQALVYLNHDFEGGRTVT